MQGVKQIRSIFVAVVVGGGVVMDTKNAISGNPGTYVSCKCNESVGFDERLASVCLELSGTAQIVYFCWLL